MPRACHVRTQPNNHRCAKRTTSSALHRRQEQIERRFERPDRVCANGVDLACPLRENRRPIPTEVPCGHFWRRLLVTKDGKDFLAGNSRKVGMFPTLSQPDSVKKYAFSAAAEERQPAAAPCGGLHRPAYGVRRVLRRLRTDKGGRLSSVTRRYRAGRSLAHRAHSKGSTPQSSSRNASDKQPSASTSFDLHIGTLRN